MTLGYVVALLVAFGFVFVLLPRVVFPVHEVEGTFLDRMIAGGVWMTALLVAAMYVLGSFGMLESFGLIVVLAAAWWFFRGRARRRRRTEPVGVRLLEISDMAERTGARAVVRESRGAVGGALRRWLGPVVRGARDRYTGPVDLVVGALVVSVLVLAAWMRFDRAMTNIELVPQDSFLALFWTKAITGGELLKDGTYPQGTYMWMSVLDRVYPFDTYQLTRFAGPLMNVLELVTLYWAASRITRSRAAGLVALTVFGIFAGHPQLLVVWPRQIGAMTQEFALGFALASLVFGARYVVEHRTLDLTLAGAGLFVAVTSNSLVIPYLAFGYAAIILVGLVGGTLWNKAFWRLILVGLVAFAVANYFFLLGWIRRIPLAQSFTLYDPLGQATFDAAREAGEAAPGAQLQGNPLFQLAVIGCVIAVAVGVMLLRRSSGKVLLASSLGILAMLLFFDFVTARLGVLFRVRQGWIGGELTALALGLGVGAIVLAAVELLRAPDALWGGSRRRVLRTTVPQVAGAALAVLLVLALWPRYSVAAREATPSGYPAADRVALRTLDRHELFTVTLVGGPEQFQETSNRGFFVEAWVFARDVTFTQARDPGYEVPIPTNDVYIFAEKRPFVGPQARPYGPAQEFYRDYINRGRIMKRIVLWAEMYRRFHDDMDIFYEDGDLRVYHLRRNVDVERADRSPEFKDYRWEPGTVFDDDGDVTTDRVVLAPATPDEPGGPE